MDKTIKILSVDDDSDITQQITDYFDGEEINGHTIELVTENNFDVVGERLSAQDYDIVILDLYRGEASEDNHEIVGAEILTEIKSAVPIAVIFYTGLTKHIEEQASDMVRVVSKNSAEPMTLLKSQIEEVVATGLPLIRKSITEHLDEVLRQYYWEFVDNHSGLLNSDADDSLLEYLLARRLAATFNKESLSRIFDVDISDEKVHPLGMYICPPITDRYEMGDILKKNDDGTFCVILTPSCDFAQDNAEKILIVQASPLVDSEVYAQYLQNKEKYKDKLKKLILSSKGDRYFFLPRNEIIDFPDVILDFQVVSTLAYKTQTEKNDVAIAYSKVAKVDDPFSQDLLAKYVRNMNRPGSPDLDADYVISCLESDTEEAP